ncbi:calcium/sodium antiporter [Actinomarinicola tropica]|uniref:Calcium/sodium antiporter n=1 Tax=Actinomarinicola tropica TaxID=2789776 RepID=A0A5Q2RBM3_9ACTN|nr:calcium/sodium antiporter [Actinomarinicola tropica]QGG94228.1 calcium/sodium antiporter [Actinomarinicola tropica]
MTAWTFVALAVGLVFLVAGAELLVRGAASIATRFGIAPVVIGLTVVAFGTSAPELAVSVSAAIGGNGEVAFGNVAGSNIANILLILGGSAVIGTLAVSQRIIRIDIPVLIGASFVALLLGLDNEIGRVDGAILFAGVVTYTWWLIRAARGEREQDVIDEYDESIEELEVDVVDKPLPVQVGLVVLGLAVLVGGSQLLVGSATDIAEEMGVSDLVIGLTVVAIGTSLPELATSFLAAYRGQRDIAVGNVVGSNLFNLLCVLGLTGLAAGTPIPVPDSALQVDVPVMLAATIVLVPIIWKGFEIRRWEGIVLVAAYTLYVTFLVLDAGDSEAVDVVRPVALVVVPLVLLGFTLAALQARAAARRPDGA